MYKIAIIGRPNVGKSTLLNKFAGKKIAITDDFSGVTRDRKEAKSRIGDIDFVAIDTAGLESKIKKDSLSEAMVEQTSFAIADADLCLFILDAKDGVTNTDNYFAKWLRKLGKKAVLVVNKCENNISEDGWDGSYYSLGFGEPVGISAEHKLGFGDLYEKILPHFEEYQKNFGENELVQDDKKADLQVAIIGRPNAGKSTLLNRILEQERLVTGPQAGITRDSISIDHQHKDSKIRFIDTAGIRKKSNIVDGLEKLSASDSFRALRFAQIAVLMLDANLMLDHQDLSLASAVLKEGRALIFAVNKIDTIKGDKEAFLREARLKLQETFKEVDGACILGISAQSGYNVEKLLDYILQTYKQWQIRIPTRKLNEWLERAIAHHGPKLYKGKETKIKYITQIKTRPPTFAVFTNQIKAVDGDYKRYLSNAIRKDFSLGLTPIRMILKKSENPFANRAKKKR